MIKHIWTVICKRSLLDEDLKTISLIDVLEEMSASMPPRSEVKQIKGKKWGLAPFEFEVVSLWIRKEKDKSTLGLSRICVHDPSGIITESREVDVDLRKYTRMRTRQRFTGIPLTDKSGLYWFHVELKQEGSKEWVEVDKIPLDISVKYKKEG